MKRKFSMSSLRKVYIEVGGQRVVAWEPKDPKLRSLGRWTDPQALLRLCEEGQPAPAISGPPAKKFQQVWRGRRAPTAKTKAPSAA